MSGQGGKEVEIIGILSSSQGKIAVISALLAGIGYSVLTSITSEELVSVTNPKSFLCFFFIISSTTVVAGNIFVAIICSMSEQEGEIAHAMSILRDNRQFDQQLEKWWQKFSSLRATTVWIFYFSVPLLFIAIALLSLIKWPAPFSYIVACLFLLFGAITTYNIFWLSSIFRSDVLLIETFQPVNYNTKLKRVLSSRDSSRYNLKSENNSPPPTPAPVTLKMQTSFHFPDTENDNDNDNGSETNPQDDDDSVKQSENSPKYSYEQTGSFSIGINKEPYPSSLGTGSKTKIQRSLELSQNKIPYSSLLPKPSSLKKGGNFNILHGNIYQELSEQDDHHSDHDEDDSKDKDMDEDHNKDKDNEKDRENQSTSPSQELSSGSVNKRKKLKKKKKTI